MNTPKKEIDKRIKEFNNWMSNQFYNNIDSENSNIALGPCYKIRWEDWSDPDYILPWEMTLKEQGWDELKILLGKRLKFSGGQEGVVQNIWFDYTNYYFEISEGDKKVRVPCTETYEVI